MLAIAWRSIFETKDLKCELGRTLAHCPTSVQGRDIDAPSAQYIAQHGSQLPGDLGIDHQMRIRLLGGK